VLIAGGETNTKLMRLNPRMAYAGGDAGAAIILSKTEDGNKGILASYLNSDGSFSTHMGVPGLLPPNQKDLDEERYFLEYSDTAETFLDEVWSATPQMLYNAANLTASEIDCFVPHQVHKKRTLFALNAAGIAPEKTINIISKFANCGSVTLLVALDAAKKQGKLNNNTIMMIAAGGGISWGGIILRT
jgi:3-oxoacyl-[acyl-carrier-protein] synthase-3